MLEDPFSANLCFARARSIPLTKPVVARLVAAIGATPGTGLPCNPLAGVVTHPLTPEFCFDAATSGPVRLQVELSSIVTVRGSAVGSSTRALGTAYGGTQVDVSANAIRD